MAAASRPPTCAPRSPILQTTLGSCRSCCLSSGAGAGRRLRGSRFRPYQPTRSRSLPRSSPRGSFSTRSCSPTLSSCSSARLVSSDACATRASARTSPLAQLALRHGQLSVDAQLLDDQRARCEDYDGCSRSSRRLLRSCARAFFSTLSQLFYFSVLSTPHRATSTRRAPPPISRIPLAEPAGGMRENVVYNENRTSNRPRDPRMPQGRSRTGPTACESTCACEPIAGGSTLRRGGARARAPAGGECSTIHDTTRAAMSRPSCSRPRMARMYPLSAATDVGPAGRDSICSGATSSRGGHVSIWTRGLAHMGGGVRPPVSGLFGWAPRGWSPVCGRGRGRSGSSWSRPLRLRLTLHPYC